MKQYKYWSKYLNQWVETDEEVTAKNESYTHNKPYYKNINGQWIMKDIPDTIDLSNTDTFHLHEKKGQRHAI